MDRRRRRGFNLPKRPYTDPPKSSLKPDSKPTVWVGGAKGSFAKGNPSAPIIQLTPQPCIDVFDAFCCKAKEVLNVDLTNPPSSIHVHTDADDAYVIDASFPLDMSVPNMIARFELRPFKANMNEVSVRVWGKMCSGAENRNSVRITNACVTLLRASQQARRPQFVRCRRQKTFVHLCTHVCSTPNGNARASW